MLAERCGYFRTVFAESPTVVDKTLVLSFDFPTVEQMSSFRHLLTFLYTDTCSVLTPGYRSIHRDAVEPSAKSGTGKTKRKLNAKDATGTCINTAIVDDPVMNLKTIARQFGVASLVKR